MRASCQRPPPPAVAQDCPAGFRAAKPLRTHTLRDGDVWCVRTTDRASRVAPVPLFHACRRQYPGGTGRCCRRSQFASDHIRTGRERGIQRPRVTAPASARATERPNPDDTSQTQTSRLVACFGHLRFATVRRVDGERTSACGVPGCVRPRGCHHPVPRYPMCDSDRQSRPWPKLAQLG